MWRGIVAPTALLISWFTLCHFGLVNEYLVPSPGKVLATAVQLWEKGALLQHIAISLYRVVLGFSLTCCIAFPLAALIGVCRWLEIYFSPMLNFIRHIPPIACIPLLILWLGIGEESKLAVIVLAAFFPVFLNCLEGFLQCDSKLLEVGTVYGFGPFRRFWCIILPSAVPSIILGMRLGLGYSWRALIGAELIAASSGIGYMMIEGEQLSRPDIVFVGILAIGLFGYAIDYLFSSLSWHIAPWDRKETDYGRRSDKRDV